MDAVSMSLDEIIKKKRSNGAPNIKSNFRQKNAPNQRPTKSISIQRKNMQSNNRPKPIIDARNKIIQRNRLKIRDAREKLGQIARKSGDVRLKLMKKVPINVPPPRAAVRKQYHPQQQQQQQHHHHQLQQPPKQLQRRQHHPQQHQYPQQQQQQHHQQRPVYYVDRPVYVHDGPEHMDLDIDLDSDFMSPTTTVLRRTVKNDIALSNMPPLPTFASVSRPDIPRRESPIGWNTDPFDCYELPKSRPIDVSEPKHLQRHVRAMAMDSVMPRKGILRNPHDGSLSPPVYIADENSSLSYEMRNRLERAPDASASMGIFSNPYAAKIQNKRNSGFRIVVSNLHSSVSQSDMKELFEDIGHLIEARLVRPGVAEVIFDNLQDAEKAVEMYHNRQLDGQPMKCLLVNPRQSNKAVNTSSTSASSLTSSGNASNAMGRTSRTTSASAAQNPNKSSVEIDIDALHKVLFRRK